MVGCVLSQLKPSGFSILCCEKNKLFSQLRMESSSGFILYIIYIMINTPGKIFVITPECGSVFHKFSIYLGVGFTNMASADSYRVESHYRCRPKLSARKRESLNADIDLNQHSEFSNAKFTDH